MKTFLLIPIFLFTCISVPSLHSQEKHVENNSTSQIKIADLMDTSMSDVFDYPIGNADGKGKYKSTTSSKTSIRYIKEKNICGNISCAWFF
jgi:hypothetical protein